MAHTAVELDKLYLYASFNLNPTSLGAGTAPVGPIFQNTSTMDKKIFVLKMRVVLSFLPPSLDLKTYLTRNIELITHGLKNVPPARNHL